MKTILAVLTVLCGAIEQARAYEVMRIGKDIHVFHLNLSRGTKLVLDKPGVEDGGHDGQMIADILGTNPYIVRRSTGLRNALAGIDNDGERYIIYDPMWFTSMDGRRGGVFGLRYLVFGHEVGHHACGHTIGMMRNDPHGGELASFIHRRERISRERAPSAGLTASFSGLLITRWGLKTGG